MTGTKRGQSHAIEWTWSRQAKRILVMAGMGYVVFWIIVIPYYFLAHEPISFISQAAEGGTFLTFGVLVPTYLLLAWVRRALAVLIDRRDRSRVEDQ